MKTLVKVLIGIAIVIALPFVLALFINNEYEVAREIAINKPRQDVFNYMKHLKNQENYNKWVMMDPNIKQDFIGEDGKVGFVYAWDSNEAGKGEQEIKEIIEGERIKAEIRFIEPFAGIAHTMVTTESLSAAQTNVTWIMKGESPYPMNFMNLFMDNTLGKDLETSLTNLKVVLEQ